ncbi:MAG: polysulfide reductase [Ignavibacteriae bacterium HGW-Ignavibacteriae-1]|jgi:Ni/Fe-hydrogenase subunit HybB-like protein|nr:MAG: polysulfide reductase [Ignavibacteriae bacterium HGW-Ignavibacteriae-1]
METAQNFLFPNEMHIYWTVMIVLYPYITGMVAGAFIVSSFYHVFGMEKLKPIAKYALVSSLAFLLFATVPLLNHLGRPERAFNIMLTPNFNSAMSGFGFVYAFYMLIVVLEIWFSYRKEFIEKYKQSKGFVKFIYKVLILGNTNDNLNTRRYDNKMVVVLGAIGIPVACILHGYVGFLFGSLKANLWWSTPLMFIIFIFSAIVSGLAVLTFLYLFVHWKRKLKINQEAIDLMSKWLWGFMIIAVTLELMEVLSIAYEQTEKWEILHQLIYGKLKVSYLYLQIGLFSIVPFLILTITSLVKFDNRIRNFLIWLSSGMLLIQVLLMRWNVVIGGQLVSKSMRGFTEYFPGLLDKEGLLVSFLLIFIPFLLLRAFDKFFPFFEKQ